MLFSNEESETEQTIQTDVTEIDGNIKKIDEIIERILHDDLKVLAEILM